MSDEVEEKQENEAAKKTIDFGFKKEEDGIWLSIRIPIEMGMWNMLGALAEAQTRVMAFFAQIEESQKRQDKGLIRPNGNLQSFKNKWH